MKPKKIRRLNTLRPAASKSTRLNKLLLAWMTILLMDPSASDAGKMLEATEGVAEQVKIVHAYTADKKVNTLAARLSSITRYVNFIDGNLQCWPPTVKGSRDYIEKVLVHAAPTALARFLESLLFIVYVFKFGRATLDTGQSLYFRGLANLSMQRLGIRKQSQPIAIQVIATMEAVMMSSSHSALVRVVMGGLLCLIYLLAIRRNQITFADIGGQLFFRFFGRWFTDLYGERIRERQIY